MYTVKAKAKEINRLSYKFVKCRTLPERLSLCYYLMNPRVTVVRGLALGPGSGTETGDPQISCRAVGPGKAGVRDMVGGPQHVIRWALRVGPGSAKR